MNTLMYRFAFRPLSVVQNLNATNNFHTSAFNMIKLTQSINAEPTKAKKRIDPQLLAAREARTRKRLEKEIKKLERHGRKLKPIEEREPDRSLVKEKELRKRPLIELTKQETDEEYFLKKEWKKYIHQQHNLQMDQIQRALKSQEYALQELKSDSLTLYNKAIQTDSQMLPFVRDGPVNTPPNLTYEPPEGDYTDVTFLYDRR